MADQPIQHADPVRGHWHEKRAAEIEKMLAALDHLDTAYELVVSIDAKVCEHIHLARETLTSTAGIQLMRLKRGERQAARTDRQADG